MAKKQTTIEETVAAKPRRVAKPRAPRVKAATHSKTVSNEVSEAIAPVAAAPAIPAVEMENPHDAIARLAYSFWEARGEQNGSAMDDWFRAENLYRELSASHQTA